MGNVKKTEIVFVLDKSGSMNTIKDDAIGGFNEFVKSQLELEGETNVTLVLFDNEIEVHNDIHELNADTYIPSGMTALLDAIGTGVSNLRSKMDNMEKEEMPDNVIFVIMTDGQENSSKEYTKEGIELIIKEHTEKHDWQFIFLGANIDSVSTAKGLGIRADFAGDFAYSASGASQAFFGATKMATSYRSNGVMDSYADATKDTGDGNE